MGLARCEHCRAEFHAKTIRRRFCNEKCRKAAWQAAREAMQTRLLGLIKVLAKEAGLTAEDFA